MVIEYNLIVNDANKQIMLKELKHKFSKYINSSLTPEGEMYHIDNCEEVIEYINNSKSLPEFIATNKDGVKIVIEKE